MAHAQHVSDSPLTVRLSDRGSQDNHLDANDQHARSTVGSAKGVPPNCFSCSKCAETPRWRPAQRNATQSTRWPRTAARAADARRRARGCRANAGHTLQSAAYSMIFAGGGGSGRKALRRADLRAGSARRVTQAEEAESRAAARRPGVRREAPSGRVVACCASHLTAGLLAASPCAFSAPPFAPD